MQMQSLSPMDYYFYRPHLYTMRMFFEYAAPIESLPFKRALESLRPQFPAAFSRLKQVSPTELILEESPEELPLEIQDAGEAFDFETQGGVDALISTQENRPGQALVKLKVLRAGEKSFVGISFSHIVGDGVSFFGFLHALAAACRGEESLRKPTLDRHLAAPYTHQEGSSAASRLFESSGYLYEKLPQPKLNCVRERFFLSSQILEDFRRELRRQYRIIATRNDVLMTLLFKRYGEQIPPSVDGSIILRCPVDYRSLHPKLSPDFFGNAIQDAVAVFRPDEISELTLPQILERLRASIHAVKEKSIDRMLGCMNDFRQEEGLEAFREITCPGLVVSNLSRLDFQSLDFGVGPALEAHHASVTPGFALILAAPGGIEVRASLPPPSKAAFPSPQEIFVPSSFNNV